MTVHPSSETSPNGGLTTGVVAWLRLARVFSKIERISSESLRDEHLSSAQFDVLAHVGATNGPSQQELADSLLVTKGNVCQLLDRMEQAGLLERRQEGRTNRLFLTEKGRGLYDRVIPRHEGAIDALFNGLTDAEQGTLLCLLRKLDRSLE